MELNLFGIKIYIKKTNLAIIIAIIIVLSGVALDSILSSDDTISIVSKNNTDKEFESDNNITSIKSNTPTPQIIDEIKVYVTGCVNSPGIVTLQKGQIIDDALKMAGGVTEEADIYSINRVYKLKENVVIYVKSKNEQQKIEDQNVEKVWSISQETGPGVELITDSGGALLGEADNVGSVKLVNINTASEAQLDTLPGIGKETAKTIIEFRTKNGDFKDIRDIMKIPGIKESRFNSIKDLICID